MQVKCCVDGCSESFSDDAGLAAGWMTVVDSPRRIWFCPKHAALLRQHFTSLVTAGLGEMLKLSIDLASVHAGAKQ